jgi:flavin-dependent dehydrogenase
MVPGIEPKTYRIETLTFGAAIENKQMLEFFTTKSPFSHWFKNASMLSKLHALMEMYPAMKVPYKGNTIFLGDSAAMAESLYAGATMCGYKGAVAVEKEFSGGKGFEEYTDWWNTQAFEMTNDLQKMAEYVKRLLIELYLGPDVVDGLFELAEKSPLTVDEFKGSPYDFARSVIDHLLWLPEVTPEWRDKLERYRSATLTDFTEIIDRIQKEKTG